MASCSPKISPISSPLLPSQVAMRSRTARSRSRKFCSTSRKSANKLRALAATSRKRSLTRVSSISSSWPARIWVISRSMPALRFSNSKMRVSGSVSLPSTICLSSSKMVSRRDSVPTNWRLLRLASHSMAFSLAAVSSKCASSPLAG
ncbi:hypothetical protein D9M68_833660 [compost metagenome]